MSQSKIFSSGTPTFTGNLMLEDPQLFLDKTLKALRVLEYSTTKAVELAGYIDWIIWQNSSLRLCKWEDQLSYLLSLGRNFLKLSW